MATETPTKPLTGDELEFWEKAFLAADIPTLLKFDTEQQPHGSAHLAAEHAAAAVRERRRVIQEGV